MSKPKNRGTHPSHLRIAEANSELLKRISGGLSVSEAAKTCWACGKTSSRDSVGWLERAHVISAAAGGTNTPDNFFLLCSVCHREQPDGSSRNAQEVWLLRHDCEINVFMSLFDPVMRYVQDSMTHRNFDPDALSDVLDASPNTRLRSGVGANHFGNRVSSLMWNYAEDLLSEILALPERAMTIPPPDKRRIQIPLRKTNRSSDKSKRFGHG